jgi:hypothetical protein
MSVHTGTYHFEVSRTAMSPEAYVPGCTSTNCLVPPHTRCTGFQMMRDSSASGVYRGIGGGAGRHRKWAVPPRPQLADVRGVEQLLGPQRHRLARAPGRPRRPPPGP